VVLDALDIIEFALSFSYMQSIPDREAQNLFNDVYKTASSLLWEESIREHALLLLGNLSKKFTSKLEASQIEDAIVLTVNRLGIESTALIASKTVEALISSLPSASLNTSDKVMDRCKVYLNKQSCQIRPYTLAFIDNLTSRCPQILDDEFLRLILPATDFRGNPEFCTCL
jgi:hypothetical protein